MKNKQLHKGLLYIVLASVLLILAVISGGFTVPAFADFTKNSTVIDDLSKDADFNVWDYPVDDKDYSIYVIQVAESKGGSLYLYTYQPSLNSRIMYATEINMSLSESVEGTKLYGLEFVRADDVFCKYLVKGVKVSSDPVRYYNITSIYRKWVQGIDDDLPEGNPNIVKEVSFEVGKTYYVKTVNGEVQYGAQKIETITVTDKYLGKIRYNGTPIPESVWKALFPLGNYIQTAKGDRHYVAFNTDRRIDILFEADVEYTKVTHSKISQPGYYDDSYSDPVEVFVPLKADVDDTYVGDSWFAREYTWPQIESVSSFLLSNTLSKGVEENLKNYKWVLSYAITDYARSTSDNRESLSEVLIDSMSILRLKFMTGLKVYNLGVVDNAQGESPDQSPDNDPTKDGGFDFFLWLANLTGLSRWQVKIIFYVLLFVLFVLLPLGILSIYFQPVLQVVLAIFKGLWWVICLPFKGIKALINKIRGDYE